MVSGEMADTESKISWKLFREIFAWIQIYS